MQKLVFRSVMAGMVTLGVLVFGAPATAVGAGSTDKLFIAHNGVALSKFPSASKLSTAVVIGVTDPASRAAWAAKSDAAWLTVTASGRTGQPLTLTANPAGLAADSFYSATVTVQTKASSTFQDRETIRVGFYIGSTDPGVVTRTRTTTSLAANPVEPFAYVSDGSPSIRLFNVYTGSLVSTFLKVAPTVGQMVLSTDGSKLFALDTTNYRIVELDARNGTALAHFQLAGPVSADFNFAYARPAGNETLYAQGQSAIDVASGTAVSAPIAAGNYFYDPYIVASPDGLHLAILERGLEPGGLYSFQAVAAGGQLTIAPVQSNSFINGENCSVMAISADGTRLYPACGAPYEFDVYDWSTLTQIQTLRAVPYPNNAVIDSNGDFIGGVDGLYEADDVFVYNPKGYLLGRVPTTPVSAANGQANNLLATSGDSTRVISVTSPDYNGTQTLMFRPLP